MLLEVDVSLIIGIVILLAFIAGAVYLSIKLNKKVEKNNSKIDWKKFNSKGQLKKHKPVLWPKELEFYEVFTSILPKGFMVIPKMGVNEIVKPNGNLVLYNAIKDKHVDFCVVKTSNMEPIAVLDTFYPGIEDSTMQELDEGVRIALQSVSIPVIKYEILDIPYDKDALLKQFLDSIDPISLAELKNRKE